MKLKSIGEGIVISTHGFFGPLHACMHMPHIGIEVGNGSKEREASLGERGYVIRKGWKGAYKMNG